MIARGFQQDAAGYWIEMARLAEKDYGFNMPEWLGVDELQSATWTVPSGVTKLSQVEAASRLTAWLRGDTVGTYAIACAFVTVAGRKDTFSFRLIVK
jgi:hypothetical protein